MPAFTRQHCLHFDGHAFGYCGMENSHALPSRRPRMKRMRLLRLPASNSVLPACCGREAGSGSGSSSTDASHADVPRPLCLPVRPAHAGTAASVAAAALIQCLAQRSAQAAEEAAAAAAEIPAAPTDVIISVSFTVAILALTIVTVGVLYLSISSFLDKRVEDEERKKYEAAQKARELQEAMGGGPKAAAKRKRTTEELTRGGGKGFGR